MVSGLWPLKLVRLLSTLRGKPTINTEAWMDVCVGDSRISLTTKQ